MTDRFRLLLNNISEELTEQNLASLIHLCNVPASLRCGMKDGLRLFEHLQHRDLISDEKVDDLKKLLEKMRPKRRDLVRLVNDYQGIPPDDASSAIGTFSRCSSRLDSDDRKAVCCSTDCPCMKCVCYELPFVPPCYFICTVIVFVALVSVCFLWYENVPHVTKYLNANEGRKKAGKYIVILLSLMFFGLVLRYLWKAFEGKRRSLFKFSLRRKSCISCSSASPNDVLIGIEAPEQYLSYENPKSEENPVLEHNDNFSSDLISESPA